MKAHPDILRQFALDERKRGVKVCEIAMRLKLPSGTVKAWLFRAHATRHATNNSEGSSQGHATRHATGQWMQSLLHDSAHFLIDGVPACSAGEKGAKIVPGMTWFPHDGCVRKCQRCMGRVQQ